MGPVVVFGASNFPLAFSTAGGDTASALAAGCPVVIKGHPMHPATGELAARCILEAARNTNMPEGVFSHLQGTSHTLGAELVKHPHTRAVGFTGSQKGGLALASLGQQRPNPIPVFAEMGSVNPVVLMPSALHPEAGWAKTYAGSVTLGTGQFCTNPGLILGVQSTELDRFISDLAHAMAEIPASCMSHANIASAYTQSRDELLSQQGVTLITPETTPNGVNQVAATVARVTGADFIANPTLQEEIFGPFTLVVSCADAAELENAISTLQGQLTATLIGDTAEFEHGHSLLSLLRDRAGRVLFNGVPTGVEVCPAMHHGGPFPATTDGRFTSVGTDAVLRWVRPVSYQNCPEGLLPMALRNDNALGIMRLVDGCYTSNSI
jgi:NADP-dependent aldehyde dehydrogenase